MIERELLMLQDSNYRDSLFLARRIIVLFQTWDSHESSFKLFGGVPGYFIYVFSYFELIIN